MAETRVHTQGGYHAVTPTGARWLEQPRHAVEFLAPIHQVQTLIGRTVNKRQSFRQPRRDHNMGGHDREW